MVDAAGAIYVIGGYDNAGTGLIYYHDVWVSSDGGARLDSVRGWSGGFKGVLKGYSVVPWGTTGVLQGY